jgi:uncharacterized protein YwbE
LQTAPRDDLDVGDVRVVAKRPDSTKAKAQGTCRKSFRPDGQHPWGITVRIEADASKETK